MELFTCSMHEAGFCTGTCTCTMGVCWVTSLMYMYNTFSVHIIQVVCDDSVTLNVLGYGTHAIDTKVNSLRPQLKEIFSTMAVLCTSTMPQFPYCWWIYYSVKHGMPFYGCLWGTVKIKLALHHKPPGTLGPCLNICSWVHQLESLKVTPCFSWSQSVGCGFWHELLALTKNSHILAMLLVWSGYSEEMKV